MAKRKYVYFGEVERFGYTLQCIASSEEECREAMINEYVTAYIRRNDANPKEAYEWMKKNEGRKDLKKLDEYYDYKDDASYFSVFLDELYIEKREFGKVEWT